MLIPDLTNSFRKIEKGTLPNKFYKSGIISSLKDTTKKEIIMNMNTRPLIKKIEPRRV